jgi:CRP/FNR family transcriptional regulator, cyclic AMP receptor protein
MSVEDALAALPVAAGLDAGDRHKLAQIGTIQHYAPGTRILAEGDPAEAVALLIDGRVALALRVPGAPDHTVLTVGSGELIGWSTLTGAPAYAATARALDAVTLILLPRGPLLALCDADHDIGYALMKLALGEVAKRLHDTRLQLLDVYRSGR